MKFRLHEEKDVKLHIDPKTRARTLQIGNSWMGSYFSGQADVTVFFSSDSPYEVNIATVYKTFGETTFVFFYLYQEEVKKRFFGLLRPKIVAKNCHMAITGLLLKPEEVEKMSYYDIAVLLQPNITSYAEWYNLGRGKYPLGYNISPTLVTDTGEEQMPALKDEKEAQNDNNY
jgi:hypothetical protein